MYLFIRVRFLGLTIEGEELWALAASVIHGRSPAGTLLRRTQAAGG